MDTKTISSNERSEEAYCQSFGAHLLDSFYRYFSFFHYVGMNALNTTEGCPWRASPKVTFQWQHKPSPLSGREGFPHLNEWITKFHVKHSRSMLLDKILSSSSFNPKSNFSCQLERTLVKKNACLRNTK